MPEDHPHLAFLTELRGQAEPGRPPRPSPQTSRNRADRVGHGGALRGSVRTLSEFWNERFRGRERDGRPRLPRGVPILLQIDPAADLDFLRSQFGFEVVAEQEDGYVIVASEDIDLDRFVERVGRFEREERGGGGVAQVHRVFPDVEQQLRLERLLDPELLRRWPTLRDTDILVTDIGVACLGESVVPNAPTRSDDETDDAYSVRLQRWRARRDAAYQQWDDLKASREEDILRIVESYAGEVLRIVDGPSNGAAELPDSFTVRVRIRGEGLRDLVLNYPFLFEVASPEQVIVEQAVAPGPAAQLDVAVAAPSADAPPVCVIDSGIQEQHLLLAAATLAKHSRSFLPGLPPTDTADYVAPSGHGTRVAGAVLYPQMIPTQGQYQLPCWILNARVLDANASLPEELFPPLLLRRIVELFHPGETRCRLFNHSISANSPCRRRHMSAWAAEIDLLSFENDILFIQAAGNIPIDGYAGQAGVVNHLVAGRPYPDYLYDEASSRLANPAQSLQALTVGSVSLAEIRTPGWQSFAPAQHPACFSRTGPGIWDVIKPEVVEFGGDNLVAPGNLPTVGTPLVPAQCLEAYPDLVRATLIGGPPTARDEVGTSFAAPKVSSIAAAVAAMLPEEPALLVRALIAHSARWPEWTTELSREESGRVIRSIGYGIPDAPRATGNTPYRVTFVTNGERRIRSREAHVFQIAIPEALRRPEEDIEFLVEVTLSYTARPRRTRRDRRRYLSTWLDWKTSGRNEALDSFKARVFREEAGPVAATTGFDWTITNNKSWGHVEGASRSNGTLQKDWARVRSHELPGLFCIAVVGHVGWDSDPDAFAKYALAVSIEAVGSTVEIYEPIRVETEAIAELVEVVS